MRIDRPKSLLAAGLYACLLTALATPAWAAQASAVVRVGGAVTQSLALTLPDLAAMPRVKVSATEHDKTVLYEGVALADILRKAGAPLGETLRGKALAGYVLVTAHDGYRVVFTLPELDPSYTDAAKQIILADTADGQPLGEKAGPVRIVVPQDKKGARWIRMVESIEVVKLP